MGTSGIGRVLVGQAWHQDGRCNSQPAYLGFCRADLLFGRSVSDQDLLWTSGFSRQKNGETRIQKESHDFCQDESHIEGLAWSGVQYLPLDLDTRFFYFLVFWFRLTDQRAVISYVRLRPKAMVWTPPPLNGI